ncbi:MAG: tRNA-modifying protein YgfZ, partial [Pseudoxanthomonas sp.]|nr:tRNA-modifying protein YgfZ [Pseudoxanthomonas sp.]
GVASGRFVPQWLGLERLPALSLRKGCYPGQEIVARIHYLGQSRRAPALVAGAGAAPEGGWRVLDDAGRDLGELADAVADGRGGWLALAALAGGGTAPVAAVAGGEEARPAGVLDAPHAPSASASP